MCSLEQLTSMCNTKRKDSSSRRTRCDISADMQRNGYPRAQFSLHGVNMTIHETMPMLRLLILKSELAWNRGSHAALGALYRKLKRIQCQTAQCLGEGTDTTATHVAVLSASSTPPLSEFLLAPAFIHSALDFHPAVWCYTTDEEDPDIVFDGHQLRIVDARLFRQLLSIDRDAGCHGRKSHFGFSVQLPWS